MQWRCRTADRIDPARRRNHNLHVASVKQLTHQRVDVMSALLSKTDLRELTMQVRLVPSSGLTSKAYLHSIISSAMESTPGRHLDEFIISTRIYYRPRCLMPKSALHSRGLFQQYRSMADLPPSIP